tara:strand:+ start:2280 stop:2465 length:186 start_codon:yes stop_codon:yes gene_type:complete
MCSAPKTPKIETPKKKIISVLKNPYDDESISTYKSRGVQGLTIRRTPQSSGAGINSSNNNG